MKIHLVYSGRRPPSENVGRGMMPSRAIRNLLSRHFRSVARRCSFPEDLRFLSPDAPAQLIVLPRHARILVCLLSSIIHQQLNRSLRSFEDCLVNNTGPQRGEIYWLGFNHRDTLERALDFRDKLEVRVMVVFHDRGPVRRHPQFLMTWGQIVYFLITPYLRLRRPVITISDPIPLSSSVRSGLRFQSVVRREFETFLRVVRGVPFEIISRQFSKAFRRRQSATELREIAKELDISPEKAYKVARRDFHSIAANPHFLPYLPAAFFCRLLFRRLFSRLEVSGIETLAEASKQATPIIVPLHRSHLDYLLVGSTIYEGNLSCPVIAAGINLNFWPFGSLARRLGAFFVRRGNKDNRIHRLVIRNYVAYLLRRGHSIEFFIEGGRSRTGKMRAPRLGILSDIVESYLEYSPREVVIVPTSITYERVLEDTSLAEENTGEGKKKENLLALFKARSKLKSKYGEVHVHYGEPLSLGTFLEESNYSRDKDTALKGFARNITIRIRNSSMLSLSSLQCTALLCAARYGLLRSELFEQVQHLHELALIVRQQLGAYVDATESLKSYLASGGDKDSGQDSAHSVVANSEQTLDGELVFIPGKTRYLAEFYKNGSVHLFAPVALLATLELLHGRIDESDFDSLYPLFEYEYQLPSLDRFLEELKAVSSGMKEMGILEKRSRRLQFSQRRSGHFIPQLLLPSLESYCHVINFLQAFDRPVGFLEFQNSIKSESRSLKYRSSSLRTESASKANLLVSIQALARLGVIERRFNNDGSITIVPLDLEGKVTEQIRSTRTAVANWLVSTMV